MVRQWQEVGTDLFLYEDTCNVYVLRDGERGVAVDFGAGEWVGKLGQIGVRRVEHVVLTHGHRDQCQGLYGDGHGWVVHAPRGDAGLLAVGDFWRTYQDNGCPGNYMAPRLPVGGVVADMGADGETLVEGVRFCGVATPGHTRGALSYVVEWRGRHVVFCGDAVHAGGTVWQPYHLEWDHWTPEGALAAWYGLERLSYCGFDLLLPAHGPVVDTKARACVQAAQRRLMGLVRAKGSVCAGEPNRWLDTAALDCGARQLSEHVYGFGGNGYLLTGTAGALVIDPTQGDLAALDGLLAELGIKRVDVATATHYHVDHTDGLNALRRRYGAAVWLHPWVAAPLADRDLWDLPWLPAEDVVADRLLPETGEFVWGEYRFGIRPFPGQTWWHCAFDADVDGQRVLFSGDNFQPPSRWNGTGGFCAFNGSRFVEGFGRSAQAALEVAPDIVCNGHGNVYRFASSQYRRILRWSVRAEAAVQALCPGETWLAEYDCRVARWQPFVSRARRGARLELRLVYKNHRQAAVRVQTRVALLQGWVGRPARRTGTVAAGQERVFGFAVEVPAKAASGRHVLVADMTVDGRRQGEVCVALVDVGKKAANNQRKG